MYVYDVFIQAKGTSKRGMTTCRPRALPRCSPPSSSVPSSLTLLFSLPLSLSLSLCFLPPLFSLASLTVEDGPDQRLNPKPETRSKTANLLRTGPVLLSRFSPYLNPKLDMHYFQGSLPKYDVILYYMFTI
jgi:hypothetical protein